MYHIAHRIQAVQASRPSLDLGHARYVLHRLTYDVVSLGQTPRAVNMWKRRLDLIISVALL
jgi:hypothetical protein